jgi:lysozyme
MRLLSSIIDRGASSVPQPEVRGKIMMKMSDQGLKILIDREDKRNKAYQDTKDIWTIGVGHTGPEVVKGLVWTDQQVMAAFGKDIERFENAVNGAVTVPLEQHQFDALVSFSFNCGVRALAHGGNGGGPSGILLALNAGDYDTAAARFDNWHIPPEITSRRNGEREQFKGTAFTARI